jgi:hypothetical protein
MAEQGLRLARATTGKRREGLILIEFGRIKQATADQEAARSLWQQAADVLHQTSPKDEATALGLLSELEPPTSGSN